MSDERFVRPKAFDLAPYWAASTKRFEAELYRDTALLRVTPRGMKLLRGLSHALADAADRSVRADAEPGWQRVTIPIESIAHATGQLLRLGADAQVLKPAALRKALVDTLAAMAALYV